MLLIVLLVSMGTLYSVQTKSTKPVKQLELAAVWTTLAVIGLAVTSNLSILLSLLIAAAVAAPLWYLTFSISCQQAQDEARNSATVWRQWQAKTGRSTPGPAQGLPSLKELVGSVESSEALVAMSNMELAPMDVPAYSRSRRL